MAVHDILRPLFEARKIGASHAASVIGITRSWFWDLIGSEDEISTLDIDQVIRTCLLFRIAPSGLLVEEHAAFGEMKPMPDAIFNRFREVEMAAYIRSLCPPYESMSDDVGWDVEGLTRWLSEDAEFFHMPYPALVDLCEYLKVHPSSVLDALWESIGQRCFASGVATIIGDPASQRTPGCVG